jgi:hypothetical protein
MLLLQNAELVLCFMRESLLHCTEYPTPLELPPAGLLVSGARRQRLRGCRTRVACYTAQALIALLH